METKLTNEEKNRRIAEACGWKLDVSETGWLYESPSRNLTDRLPNYFECLNACHEAKKTLTNEQCHHFQKYLLDIGKASVRECQDGERAWSERWTWGQPPEVEADCLGLTLKLWEAGE
jgi:hypothetical protein